MQFSQRICADDPHGICVNIPDALAESPQAFQCDLLTLLVQTVHVIQAGGQSDHFANAIDNFRLSVRQPSHDHMKTIRAQIYRR